MHALVGQTSHTAGACGATGWNSMDERVATQRKTKARYSTVEARAHTDLPRATTALFRAAVLPEQGRNAAMFAVELS